MSGPQRKKGRRSSPARPTGGMTPEMFRQSLGDGAFASPAGPPAVRPTPGAAWSAGGDVEKDFADAQRLGQAGGLAAAERLYRSILQRAPAHVGAMHFLGIAVFQQGRPDEGLQLVERSIELGAGSPPFLKNFFSLLCRAGKKDQALAIARRLAETDRSCIEAVLYLADAMLGAAQYRQAADYYQRALSLEARLPAAWNRLALCWRQMGETNRTLDILRQALLACPLDAELHSNLGMMLLEAGDLEQSARACREAIAIKPDMADAHRNLGAVLRKQDKLPEAKAAARKAVELNPNMADAWYLLGNILLDLEMLPEAREALGQAIGRRPNYSEAHAAMGLALRQEGRLGEASAAFDAAMAGGLADADLRFSRSLLLLQMGQFEQGWREYQWGWRNNSRTPSRRLAQPIWEGGDLTGKTIFIAYEQGLGDVIQFARYGPLLAQRGARVVMDCQQSLVPLLRTMRGIEQILPYGSPLPHFDTYRPLLDLPGVLHTDLRSIPGQVPYYHPPASDIARWDQRLGRSQPLRVGLAWAGNPLTRTAKRKLVPLGCLSPLLATRGVSFYSLQVNLPPAELAAAQGLGIMDLSVHFTDFAQTAAAIADMDLIISVDTAVAHLAGALARPVWVLLPLAADWRWMAGRDDSPWYPTMRLFRQEQAGNWPGVIRKVSDELRRMTD